MRGAHEVNSRYIMAIWEASLVSFAYPEELSPFAFD